MLNETFFVALHVWLHYPHNMVAIINLSTLLKVGVKLSPSCVSPILWTREHHMYHTKLICIIIMYANKKLLWMIEVTNKRVLSSDNGISDGVNIFGAPARG
jgi:hypothetical protein